MKLRTLIPFLLIHGVTLPATAWAQIPGTRSLAALIYQDMMTSNISQVVIDDSGNQGSSAPGSPPPTTFSLTTATGTLGSTLNAPPGQIMRWQLWAQRGSPNQWFLLDVKAVLPIQETLTVTSLDDLNPQLTRVGKNYSVLINVAGMPTYSSGATEVGEVYLGLSAVVDGTTYGFRSLAGYTTLENPPVNNASTLTPLAEDPSNAWFLTNGTIDIANLAPSQPGQETWLIDWIETAESNSSVIDESSMQVLAGPTLTANQPIQALYSGDTSSLPALDLNFNNLFPGSLTVFQISDAQGNPLTTLTVNDDRSNASATVTHTLNHLMVPLSTYITQPGTYTLQAWTAEPFTDGLASIAGTSTPSGYTWSPLPIPGTSTIVVQFTARVNGAIITN